MFVQGCLPAAPGAQRRRILDAHSWVDLFPGWLADPDGTFDALARQDGWHQRTRIMWGQELCEPRLTRGWAPGTEPPVLAEMRRRLGELHHPRPLGAFWVNLYRDGQDAVAWHRDRIGRAMRDPLVLTVTLGSRRRFLLRPRGGGPSTCVSPGPGDLLVMGGACQHDWEHSVPRCAGAGPRMSVTIREIPPSPDPGRPRP